ncbi:MAG: DUF167 domain-containing protein [Deltaproteobacteria bacterium]|nr:DUF167 domain-containing protein [Deltaproteobacteria bacterium]
MAFDLQISNSDLLAGKQQPLLNSDLSSPRASATNCSSYSRAVSPTFTSTRRMTLSFLFLTTSAVVASLLLGKTWGTLGREARMEILRQLKIDRHPMIQGLHTFSVRVTPDATMTSIRGCSDEGSLLLDIQAPRMGGNQTVVSFLREVLGLTEGELKITKGERSTLKTLRVAVADAEMIRIRMADFCLGA